MIGEDSGQLSLDFIIGFAIFMIAFIFVVTMVSGLLIGLQSKTIDYDGAAYRTGVILVEDPGEGQILEGADYVRTTEWQEITDKNDIKRFGLAFSKSNPLILNESKVEKFFTSADFVYPEDFRDKMIFNTIGGYPYFFNIKLTTDTNSYNKGDSFVNQPRYGFIKRAVSMRELSGPEALNEPIPVVWIPSSNINKINLFLDIPISEQSDPLYWNDPLDYPIEISIDCSQGNLQDVYISDINGNIIDGFNNLAVTVKDINGITTENSNAYPFSNVVYIQTILENDITEELKKLRDAGIDVKVVYEFQDPYSSIDGTYRVPIPPISLTPAILEVRVW